MLLALIPLFDENINVKAYSVFAQRENQFLNPFSYATGMYDGSTYVEGLEAVMTTGLGTLSDDKPVFVPVSNVAIFSELESVCTEYRDRIILLIDRTIPPIPMYIDRLKELKNAGFRLAIRRLAVPEFQVYSPIIAIVDFIFLNNKKIAIDKAMIYFQRLFPDVKLIAGNIDTMEEFENIKSGGGYDFYEGEFYRIPAGVDEHEITPMKATKLRLLQLVNSSDFELNDAASVISNDTAITVQLLQMVNRIVKMSEIKTIKHAAAMLGQRELKKWINTVVMHNLCGDRPNELTRLSLLRAKFAENLSDVFGMKDKSDELFLMGLFSIIDVVLEKPMEDALDILQLSQAIKDALVKHEGQLGPVFDFMMAYETADWSEVSRVMTIKKFDTDKVYRAYIDSLSWYRETIK
ncbi:MAG: HDOD domain-containing protein [Lachnospiraceae bacterium]|nr:HDOD domain-containing protein [Lachnospiraceae bacterium]